MWPVSGATASFPPPPPPSTLGSPLRLICSQVPLTGTDTRDRELPSAACQSAKANLGLGPGEAEVRASLGGGGGGVVLAPATEGSAPPGDLDEDGTHSHYSNSTASSQCSATYSNLGKTDSVVLNQ